MLDDGPYPNLRIRADGWHVADANTARRFSGLLFAFGLPLQKELDVPIGLIAGAAGGTASARWVTPGMIADDPTCRERINKAGASYTDPESSVRWFANEMAGYNKALAAYRKGLREREPYKPPRQLDRGDLFVKRVRPVIPYAVRGVLWDQGESGTAVDALDQCALTGALIRGWRKAWGQDKLPFLYVQKPSGGGCAWDYADPVTREADAFAPPPETPNDAGAGEYRELHIRIMSHPDTAMVVASDLGSGVHPVNKAGYGARAARTALGFVYGRDVEYYGPIYQSHAVEGRAIRVRFSHAPGGLAVPKGQTLQGFEIAGADGVWHWADAKIEGKTVVVSSAEVASPTAVRYGWAQSHPWANLFNTARLPALTFRAGKRD